MGIDMETRIRAVTAVLGPTNTGKTHLAIERMLGHETGLIGLPLRLLAREVYDKIAARVGAAKVALITGEEKIKPDNPRYWVCTVEAMPRSIDVNFLAIDEVQLAADPERGHVFTDRLLHARGRMETLLLGAATMREAIADLIPGANFISRPRLSKLAYAGEKKITRLPARTAVVAFSASEVYAVAELIRRQRGGAAVVLGALSPRTRNAQVALYQSGDVDFLVATDAIGMGLNLDVDHVAFAATRKFDGQVHRDLTPAELAQIAGRAGRHMNDGRFGVTGDVPPFEQDLIDRLETHTFDNVKTLQWRNRKLDCSSLEALRNSLREAPREPRLVRARTADDVMALETVCADPEVVARACGPPAVATLWEVCQVPDYRKISAQNHAELVATLYKFVMGPEERIPADWFAQQVEQADRTDGDIDTLANRLAHIRTWTFVSNRPDWLNDPEHWQERTRAIEDSLSDALHELLTQRFVDRRTSALMKGLRDKDELAAEIAEDGSIRVENHYVGRLKGFRFSPDAQAEGIHGKAARHAAAQVLAKELSGRARRVAAAKSQAFKLRRHSRIVWREEEIGRLEAGEDPLKPQVVLLADEHLVGPERDKVQERLNAWIADAMAERLKPLVEIAAAADVTGLARGIAFRLTENFGTLKRESAAEEIKSLDQAARAQLRKYGVRFGAFNIYFPLLLKPASAELTLALWALKNTGAAGPSLEALPAPPRAGLTSLPVDPALPEAYFRACGYHVCGPRAVRIDILERLADLIRPLLAWRARPDNSAAKPKGATGDGGFTVVPEMMSILGCSAEEIHHVLKALGFRVERRLVKPAEVAASPSAGNSAEAAASPPAVSPAEAAASQTAAVPDEAAASQTAAVPDESAASQTAAAPAEAAASQTASVPDESAASQTAAAPDEAAASQTAVAQAEAATVAQAVTAGSVAPQHMQVGMDETAAGPMHGAEPRSAPAEITVAETAAAGFAEAMSQPPAAAAPSAEPEPRFEEVWRPRRRRDKEREHGERAPRWRKPSARKPSGQSRIKSGPDGRPPEPARPPVAADTSIRQEPTAAADTAGREQDRGQDRRGERRPKDDRRRREDRPARNVRSAGPVPRSGAVDPDSPFAKLSALKQVLEQRAREQNSS